jgi:hypothetical protein
MVLVMVTNEWSSEKVKGKGRPAHLPLQCTDVEGLKTFRNRATYGSSNVQPEFDWKEPPPPPPSYPAKHDPAVYIL